MPAQISNPMTNRPFATQTRPLDAMASALLLAPWRFPLRVRAFGRSAVADFAPLRETSDIRGNSGEFAATSLLVVAAGKRRVSLVQNLFCNAFMRTK
jgi:hypothetical protein